MTDSDSGSQQRTTDGDSGFRRRTTDGDSGFRRRTTDGDSGFRVLAVFCGAFSAGIFAAQYILPSDCLLYGAAAAFALACLRFFVPGNLGKRILLIGAALALSLGWNWLYLRRISAPAAALSGTEQPVLLTLRDYPVPTPYGVKATVRIPGVPGLVTWYAGPECAGREPGQTVRDTVRFQDAGRIREDDVTTFTSRGVFLLAYGQGNAETRETDNIQAAAETREADNLQTEAETRETDNIQIAAETRETDNIQTVAETRETDNIQAAAEIQNQSPAESAVFLNLRKAATALRALPARSGNAVRKAIRANLSGDEAAILSALLTGERSGLSEQASADLEEAGLTHVLAVSGMHCGFLLALPALLMGRHRRRLLALCAVPILLFFALLTGGRPSVVRACVMLLLLLAAPLFRRESDPPTALAAALFLILLHNPYAAASISLQLSFAAVAGLLWLSPKAYFVLAEPLERYRLFLRREPPFRILRTLAAFTAAGLSAALGALAFTAPLSGYYFGVLSLIAPLSGVLCLWAVGAAFVTGLLAAAAAAVPFLGPAVAAVPGLLVRYILAVSHALARVPGHAVYFNNPLLKYWLAFAYILCAAAWLSGRRGDGTERHARRKAMLTAALLSLTLFCAAFLYRTQYRHAMDAVMLDVGQGQSVLLASRGRYALADCGSSNSWYSPGAVAARKLRTLGCSRLDVLVLTHFDGDHVNGVEALLARVPVRELLVPDAGANETASEDGTAKAGDSVSAGNTKTRDSAKAENSTNAGNTNARDSIKAGDTNAGDSAKAADANAGDSAKAGDANAGDSTKARDAVLSLAERYGVTVKTVTEREALPFGAGTLTVFPPVGASGDNDRGLSLLASVGEADFLITGDMGQAAEKKLLSAYSLPDLEAFAAGHHGSKYSTSAALLDALKPEAVCVSVGSNSYGHPAPETLDRLAEYGCAVYRTDRDGDIHFALDG